MKANSPILSTSKNPTITQHKISFNYLLFKYSQYKNATIIITIVA